MADVDIQVERVQSPQIAVDLVPPIEVPVSLGGPVEVNVEVMARGPAGPAGSDGADGQGVPTGGADGQVLAKASAADYDTEWIDAAAGGGEVDSVNGQTGVVVLDTDDVAEGVNKYMTSAEKTKLAGIASGATQNATDAQLRDRATHTGSQAISTVTGLQTALDGKATTAQGTLADSAVQPGDLATVATTGDYADLANTPSIPAQFNPIAGTNVSLTGTYPNITFNASGGGGGAVDSVNGATGVVVLDQDDIADGTTAKQYTATEQTKLAGIATGATANDTDANLKNRANHTGSQAISTVTGLQTALDAKEPTITAGTSAQYYRGDKTWQTLNKAAVGLANVDNTSDASKPVSTAQQTAIDAKVANTITDGVTTVAPSQNAVFDALALKQSRLVYNALDYGITADGTTDDQPAFETLTTTVAAAGGGTIYLPPGIYRVNNPITVKSNVSFIGAGVGKTIFRPNDGGTRTRISAFYCYLSYSEADPVENVTFANFEIDGVNQTNTTYSHSKGIYVQYMRNCVFRDLYIHDTMATGLGIDYLDKVSIFNVHVYTGGRDWIAGRGGGAGIGIGTGGMAEENFIITNCVTVDCGQHGIFVEDQSLVENVEPAYPSKGIVIGNNVVRDGRNCGIGICGGQNITVSGNQVYGNTDTGIIVQRGNATMVTITGNTVWDNQRGIELDDDEEAEYVSITITGNNLRANAGYQIYMGGAWLDDIIVEGNIITRGLSGGIALENVTTLPRRISIKNNNVNINQSYGIKINTAANVLDIVGNQVTSNVGGGVYIASAISNLTLLSNSMVGNTSFQHSITGTITGYQGDVYIPWSPTYASITPGNGTVVARYRRVGDRVDCQWRLICGSTTAVGSSATISLPVSASSWYGSSAFQPVGDFTGEDALTKLWGGAVLLDGSNNVAGIRWDDGTGGLITTIQFTETTGDTFNATWSYEAA